MKGKFAIKINKMNLNKKNCFVVLVVTVNCSSILQYRISDIVDMIWKI